MAHETVSSGVARKIRAAVFASGAGSIAQALIERGCMSGSAYEVVLIISNNSNSGARLVAENFKIPFRHISGKTHPDERDFVRFMLEILREFNVEIIVLAGYNKLMPAEIVACFRGRILNVHPSLLPKYGGSGMFGLVVHQQVVKNMELFSGSTVHIVDEVFDNGEIIGQTRIKLAPDETPETLEEKIKAREREFYPRIVNEFAEKLRQ